LPGMDDQEVQDVDRAVPRIVELHLLDGTGDAAANRHPLQDLAIGHLVGTDDPDPKSGRNLAGVILSVVARESRGGWLLCGYFTPRRSLSLGSRGSQTLDSSASSVLVIPQISTRRCQSTHERASRDASRARTSPT